MRRTNFTFVCMYFSLAFDCSPKSFKRFVIAFRYCVHRKVLFRTAPRIFHRALTNCTTTTVAAAVTYILSYQLSSCSICCSNEFCCPRISTDTLIPDIPFASTWREGEGPTGGILSGRPTARWWGSIGCGRNFTESVEYIRYRLARGSSLIVVDVVIVFV